MLSKQDEHEINALRNLREGLRWGLIREIRGKLCGTEYVCRSTEEVDAILEAAE